MMACWIDNVGHELGQMYYKVRALWLIDPTKISTIISWLWNQFWRSLESLKKFKIQKLTPEWRNFTVQLQLQNTEALAWHDHYLADVDLFLDERTPD